ncbi:hypothetical protein GOODEAATRI_001480, partial [Goodea atripinnis]
EWKGRHWKHKGEVWERKGLGLSRRLTKGERATLARLNKVLQSFGSMGPVDVTAVEIHGH